MPDDASAALHSHAAAAPRLPDLLPSGTPLPAFSPDFAKSGLEKRADLVASYIIISQ
jgi:hypothetical protein